MQYGSLKRWVFRQDLEDGERMDVDHMIIIHNSYLEEYVDDFGIFSHKNVAIAAINVIYLNVIMPAIIIYYSIYYYILL